MALARFLRILRARWITLVVTFALILGATATGTMLWPARYSASVHLLLDVKQADPVTGTAVPAMMTPSYLATEFDVITSQRVALRVVEELRLDQNAALREKHREGGGSAPIAPWLADLLVSQLKVKPTRDSTVIQLSYAGADPKFAAVVANAFARSYVETNLRLKVEPARQQAAWFDERAATLRARVDTAQRRLSDYQRQNRITSIDERLDVETARLNELSTQLTALQAQLVDSAQRHQVARAAGGEIDRNDIPEVLASSQVQALKSELSRLEQRRTEVLTTYGSAHPDHERTVEQIRTVRTRLGGEIAAITQALGRTVSVNSQREAEIRASLERQRERVLDIRHKRDEFAVLVKDLENAQKAFDEVSVRGSRVSLESQARITNATILDEAVPPAQPTSPRMLVNMIIAAVVGLLLAVALVLALELPAQRVLGEADLADGIDLPLLGEIRRAERSPRSGRKVGRLTFRRLGPAGA